MIETSMMVKKKTTTHPEVLQNFPFFASFSMDQLEEIAETAEKVSFKSGQVVFKQGDRSETMYLILKGIVKIEREDEDGELFAVGEKSEYEIFGELAMLSKEARQASVTVVKDLDALAINRAMMLDIIRKSDPEEILEVFSVLGDQVRTANDAAFKQALERRTLAAHMEVEKQRALTQMVAGVAHEINTPLSVINTAVSIMARELAVPQEMTTQRAADIAESLELMRRNVERAHRLVQDFKKVSVSQLSDELELFDLAEAVQEIAGLIMVSLKRNQVIVKFSNKLSPEYRQWVGYHGFLSQIIINLLTNAERYAYPKGSGGVVDIKLEMEDEKNYRLTVRDHGKGIPPENLSKIFEPFFTTGRSVGGTGLGLSIVHNLVTNALKGEIKCKSTEGKGTEFVVTFPRVLPD